EADQILGRVPGLIPRVAPRVGPQRTAVRARDVHLVAVLGELQERMRELGPPEADGPAGLFGDGRVGRDDHDPLRPVRGEDVDGCGQRRGRYDVRPLGPTPSAYRVRPDRCWPRAAPFLGWWRGCRCAHLPLR